MLAETAQKQLSGFNDPEQLLQYKPFIKAERLLCLFDFARQTGSVSDLDKLLDTICKTVVTLANVNGCAIRLKGRTRYTIRASYGLTQGVISILAQKVGEEVFTQVLKKNQTLLIDDTRALPNELRVLQLMIRSMAVVPLKTGSSLIGTLEVYDKTRLPGMAVPLITKDDLLTLEGFAILAALSIERALAHKKELEWQRAKTVSQNRMEILFNSVNAAIATVNRTLTITTANKAIEKWTSFSVVEIPGRKCHEVFPYEEGVCPQCVAEATFESGQISTVNYVKNDRYAEISAYPIREEDDRINECIVMIRDISDRIASQIEITELYKKVSDTKERLESLIENSADAIITANLECMIISWNKSAESIFGFTHEETLNTCMPFLPESAMLNGKAHLEAIRHGEILKDVETSGTRKDGSRVDISLTISPIKDAAGVIAGMSIIARDISLRKSIAEKLVNSNRKFSRLFFISSAMRGTLELDRLLRMILTAVTVSDGLGFNRAIIFLCDEHNHMLKGKMGVGPANNEEAARIWHDLSSEVKSLHSILQEIESGTFNKDSFMDKLSISLQIPLDSSCYLSMAVAKKTQYNVTDAVSDPLSNPILTEHLNTEAYLVVPIIARNKAIGVLWVDNLFNHRPITDDDAEFLLSFADQAATAIESARLFEQVKLAETELENIFESINDLVYITDMDLNIIKVNKSVCDLTGLTPEETIGKKCYEIFHNCTEPWPNCSHKQAIEKGKSRVIEVEGFYYRTKDTCSVSISPIYDHHGELKGTIHIVSNVTEIKSLREQLASIEKVAALGEMSARVAHEIRNPLSSIGGFARRLEKKLDEPLKEYAHIIVNEVGRLEALLRQTLSFVRENKIANEKVDINALLHSVISKTEWPGSKKISIEEKYAQKTLEIIGNPGSLKEAIFNIIDNARQAVAGGGRIIVRTKREQDMACIEVEDTGAGITPEELKHLFDPFYTTKTTGAGLGLTIAQKIIEEHKGTIEVESSVGVGTIFKIKLLLKEGNNE
ncbi:PAS domain S-box protein [Candidatus Magnetomonas plexicatena]|uniref:PAS domain S-box protein n=1 Tax=Candidatus Magnetomonas plexicatena TaxID=2552947 RepID=UPI001C75D89F|nr:PAS domain S-box protein [Nitrospirales bacterium LBB_01]